MVIIDVVDGATVVVNEERVVAIELGEIVESGVVVVGVGSARVVESMLGVDVLVVDKLVVVCITCTNEVVVDDVVVKIEVVSAPPVAADVG